MSEITLSNKNTHLADALEDVYGLLEIPNVKDWKL
jgi:hypothetical protein